MGSGHPMDRYVSDDDLFDVRYDDYWDFGESLDEEPPFPERDATGYPVDPASTLYVTPSKLATAKKRHTGYLIIYYCTYSY